MSGPMYSDPHSHFLFWTNRFFELDAIWSWGKIASETDGWDPHQLFKICKGSAEITQKGGTSHFGVAMTFARREPYLGFIPSSRRVREENRCMGSEIIYFEINKREKYGDSDERVDLDLAVVKTKRYHVDDEPFIHPLHSIRFRQDRPYELLIESLLALRR
ncbi:hypothetical protein PIB30_062356 [Stylosanthes scabra]|uniref:Uncharacterized protein n=1 Tax=Stylosanthes scabra TaxID=79078 RepID=A0ABU6YLM5_9FABA|nr:hypothetical protein [Stylosanthes scabra]